MSDEIVIQLSVAEITTGAITAVMRQVDNIAKSRQGRNNEAGMTDWQLHVEGALGEMAVAKWLKAYWSGEVGNLSAADIQDTIQVRTTARHNGHLILHEWDKDDDLFFLVIGKNGTYKIVGWISGHVGKKLQYWRDPTGSRPAYFIPALALQPPTLFYSLVYA